MMNLSSNGALYDYLIDLASVLKQRGASELSNAVSFAARQAASSSTEFLGEARLALRKVFDDSKLILTTGEINDVDDAIKQITAALNKWPRANLPEK